MTDVTRHAPGTFCWIDLATTDPAAAKTFYSQLLGWTHTDVPTGDTTYSLLHVRGKDIGGLSGLMKEQQERGVPPHWTSYVCVTSAADATAKAKSLGGKAIMEAFDVMEHGRMAVLQDPTGGIFAVWEPKQHIGAGVLNEPGALCWNELMTTNTDVAGRFYTQLFNWKSESMQGTIPYTMFKLGDQPVGGMTSITPEMGPIPPNWMVYFAVNDCDKVAAEAKRLGAAVHVPPKDIPNMGRFSVLQDPQGAAFAIFQSKSPA